jgi:hypothetical protein
VAEEAAAEEVVVVVVADPKGPRSHGHRRFRVPVQATSLCVKFVTSRITMHCNAGTVLITPIKLRTPSSKLLQPQVMQTGMLILEPQIISHMTLKG